MTPDAQTLKHITSWIKQLHDAVPRHAEDDPPTKEKWAVLASLLGQDFPSGAFTMASLKAAAEGCAYFPVYDVIRQKVGAWWQMHMPPIARSIDSDPRYQGLSDTERFWLRDWDSAVLRSFGPKVDGKAAVSIGVMDSLLRQHAPRVWDRLNRSSMPASHAAAAEWLKKDWDDDEWIYERVFQHRDDSAALGLLHSLVSRHAPQHLHMVPAPTPDDGRDRERDQRPAVKPLYLSPAQADAARAAGRVAATAARGLRR